MQVPVGPQPFKARQEQAPFPHTLDARFPKRLTGRNLSSPSWQAPRGYPRGTRSQQRYHPAALRLGTRMGFNSPGQPKSAPAPATPWPDASVGRAQVRIAATAAGCGGFGTCARGGRLGGPTFSSARQARGNGPKALTRAIPAPTPSRRGGSHITGAARGTPGTHVQLLKFDHVGLPTAPNPTRAGAEDPRAGPHPATRIRVNSPRPSHYELVPT